MLMPWWKVEVKEKDSHFTGFLQGPQQRGCLPPDKDMVGCCSVHTWKAASHRPCPLLLLSLCSLALEDTGAASARLRHLWEFFLCRNDTLRWEDFLSLLSP